MATPPDFSVGQILTASQMNAIGLWRITTCTVTSTGGTSATASDGIITLGNGNTSVTVSNAFSADFANYKIQFIEAATSGVHNIEGQLGSTAGTSYFSSRIKNQPNSGTPAGDGLNGTAAWSYFAQGSTNMANLNVDLFAPQLPRYTFYAGTYFIEIGASTEFGTTQGFVNTTTQYTSFKLNVTGGGSFTRGKIVVYGYNA